ncbi:MAG: protein kinase domain-containing protein [Kiritimatiellia bacterium]
MSLGAVIELEVLEGYEAGTRVALKSELLVGRSVTSGLVLEDPSLSKFHCRFRVVDGVVTVTDLGSTNGTLVNGIGVLRSPLEDGDQILVGSTILVLHKQTVALDADWQGVPDLMQGQVFGQIGYTLNRKIADGGMGSVFEGVQYGAEGFEKRVAIKTILPGLSEQDDFVASFVEEARLAADLVHPNIVQIYHLGRHAGGYYIAMEYVDGITVDTFLKIHRELGIAVPVVWAVYITGSIARALDYAYKHLDRDGYPMEMVHRDVSTNNIMIAADGGVKLTDFGVARIARESSQHDCDLVGCVEFMSPEQAACRPLDGRSDQFALGLVFFEMLTGERVFHSDPNDIEGSLQMIQDANIPDPRDCDGRLPDDVCAMVSMMLRRDPQDRYRDSGMVADACDAYLRLCGCLLTAADLAAYVEDLEWRYAEENAEEPDE